jgi:hypothetical protein
VSVAKVGWPLLARNIEPVGPFLAVNFAVQRVTAANRENGLNCFENDGGQGRS